MYKDLNGENFNFLKEKRQNVSNLISNYFLKWHPQRIKR